MSEVRKKRQQKRSPSAGPNPLLLKIVIVVAILVVGAGLYFLLRTKQNSRMDAFARCLTTKGAKMYGAYWCPHCADQKELFGSSFQYAPYIECGIKGSHAEAQVCVDAGIKHFPTWIFADGIRVEGTQSLALLGDTTGCALP
ncbi:MAG: hypothetical protein WAL32_13110 [Terriglobales bacterium]